MKKPAWLKLWLPVFICFTLWTFSLPCSYGAQKADTAQADKDKKAIVKRARDGYYSLRKLGLVKFEASITPNWVVTLKDQIKSDPSSAQASLKLLNGLHFAMDLGADGNVKVTHHTDVAPASEQMAASFDQIYGGMEQAVSGFFASWSIFMLTSPFPEVESDYKLEERKARTDSFSPVMMATTCPRQARARYSLKRRLTTRKWRVCNCCTQ